MKNIVLIAFLSYIYLTSGQETGSVAEQWQKLTYQQQIDWLQKRLVTDCPGYELKIRLKRAVYSKFQLRLALLHNTVETLLSWLEFCRTELKVTATLIPPTEKAPAILPNQDQKPATQQATQTTVTAAPTTTKAPDTTQAPATATVAATTTTPPPAATTTVAATQSVAAASTAPSTPTQFIVPTTSTATTTGAAQLVRDCFDIHKNGYKDNAVYQLKPGSNPFTASCELAGRNAGWTIFQRRTPTIVANQLNMNRGWSAYKLGFGDRTGEYWMGLENLYQILQLRRNVMEIEIITNGGGKVYAHYDNVSLSNEQTGYQLRVAGFKALSGVKNADILSCGPNAYETAVNGNRFSTPDGYDNDQAQSLNCAGRYQHGWWFNNCFGTELNYPYDSTYFRYYNCGESGYETHLKGSVIKFKPFQ